MIRASETTSGSIPFASASAREQIAAEIAGLLAECSVQRLTIADPRVCRTREVAARETNLPNEIIEGAPGTTIAGNGVALLIDESCIRWVAGAPIAVGLQALADGSSLNR